MITRANVYARDNGTENIAVTILDNKGVEYVAHLPWNRFQGAGIMLPEQLVSTNIQVTYLSKGEPTLNGGVCDKDDTLISSFIADAMIESAEAFGAEIRKALVDHKAQQAFASMNAQQEIRAKARTERLKALKASTASTPPAVTAEDEKAPELKVPQA